jgi:hypothetical protein
MKKMMLLMLTLLIWGTASMNAQVTIGSNSNPDAAAVLDLQATDKGLLIPRVALTAIDSPLPLTGKVAGMVVYNTGKGGVAAEGIYYNDGANWVKVGSGTVTTDNQGINALTGDVSAPLTTNGSAATTIADNAVTLDKLADNSVNSSKIIDGSIASADLANNSVTSAHIVDATITNADIANSTIAGGKLVSSIALVGSPTTTTQPAGTENATIATTEFVSRAVSASTGASYEYLGSVYQGNNCPSGTRFALGDYVEGRDSSGSPNRKACFK